MASIVTKITKWNAETCKAEKVRFEDTGASVYPDTSYQRDDEGDSYNVTLTVNLMGNSGDTDQTTRLEMSLPEAVQVMNRLASAIGMVVDYDARQK